MVLWARTLFAAEIPILTLPSSCILVLLNKSVPFLLVFARLGRVVHEGYFTYAPLSFAMIWFFAMFGLRA